MGSTLSNVLQLFRQKSFFFFWMSHALTSVDTAVRSIALVWLVMDLTGRASSLSVVLLSFSIPRVFFLLFGGVLTDRCNSKIILELSYFCSALLTFIIVIVAWEKLLTLSILSILLFLLGVSDGIAMPAARSVIPTIVPIGLLQQANALDQFVPQLSMVIGSSVVGVLVTRFGPIPVFLMLAIIYSISFCLVLAISSKKIKNPTPFSIVVFFDDIKDSVIHIFRSQWMPGLFLLDIISNFAFAGIFSIVLPLWAKNQPGIGSGGLGIIIAAFGLGSLLGVIVSVFYNPKRIGLTFCAMNGLQGLCLAIFPFVPLLVATSLLMAVGFMSGLSGLFFINLISERVEKNFLGRIMGFMGLAIFGLQPISQLVAGFLIVKCRPEILFVSSSLIMIAGSLIIIAIPAIRSLKNIPKNNVKIQKDN